MLRILNEISKIGNEGKCVFSGRKDSILAPCRKHGDGAGIKSMLVAGRDALIRGSKSFHFFCKSHTPPFLAPE
jgi:hypothetical protein